MIDDSGSNARSDYQQVRAEFDALLSAAVDAIIIIDQNGLIETFNAAAVRMFEYPTEAVIGKNISMLMPEPYSSQHDQYVHNYLNTGRAKIIGIGREVQAIRADGEIFPIELSVGEIVDSEHTSRKFVGIIRDITARVHAEIEARENREKLSHVSRVSMMGEMASGIAHEINQPLTAIMNYSQACIRLLKDTSTDRQSISEVLEKVSAQAQRAGEVIRRLREFFKKRSGEREHCNLNEIIRESVDICHADTRLLDHPVILELDRNLPEIYADEIQLQQVVINLLRNAVDAMENHRGKPVSIASRIVNEDFLIVTVTDQGGGVEPNKVENLFNPFFSTKVSGMGMGLAISKSIVNSHGGKLWYAPIEDGSTFNFTVPISPT